MQFITKLGDISLLMPLSFVLALTLWHWETPAAAKRFMAGLGLCLTTTLVLKLLFLTCNDQGIFNISSPSGHTAASTFVFGSLGLVLSNQCERPIRVLIRAAALVLVLGIAASRVAVGAHSFTEVALAMVVGTISFFYFAKGYSQMKNPRFEGWILAIAAGVVVIVLYGTQAPAERFIRKIAALMRVESNACTFQQGALKPRLPATT